MEGPRPINKTIQFLSAHLISLDSGRWLKAWLKKKGPVYEPKFELILTAEEEKQLLYDPQNEMAEL